MAFSPDGQWIATGGDDQTAKVWQTARAETGRCLAGGRTGGGAVSGRPAAGAHRRAEAPTGRSRPRRGRHQTVAHPGADRVSHRSERSGRSGHGTD